MVKFVSRAVGALVVLPVLPAAAHAQAAITCVVKDAAGGCCRASRWKPRALSLLKRFDRL
jgi:hypothetical protein